MIDATYSEYTFTLNILNFNACSMHSSRLRGAWRAQVRRGCSRTSLMVFWKFLPKTDTYSQQLLMDVVYQLQLCCFCCFQYPELNPMIMRRFQEPGDVEKAFELVHKSQGLDQTQFLAKKHCLEAVRLANTLAESDYQKGLIVVSDLVINRIKQSLDTLLRNQPTKGLTKVEVKQSASIMHDTRFCHQNE